MSGLPPTIDSHTLPRTPADEWANNTTNALDSNHVSNRNPSIPHFASTGTPSEQLPGAFPRGADLSAPPTSEDTRRLVEGMVGTAKQRVPDQQDVQRAILNASDTAKQYLPESVGSYLPGTNSTAASNASALPSKEVPGGSSVGVGSLPGSNSETSVAKLPEERVKEGTTGSTTQGNTGLLESAKQYIPPLQGISETAMKYVPESIAAYLPGAAPAKNFSLPSTETPSGSAGGVGSLPGTASEVSVAKLPEERRQDGLPSHETEHERLGKTDGVGALPGAPNESSVALLPEERIHGEGVVPDHERLGKTGGVGVLPGGHNESGVALLPEERVHGEDDILKSSSGGRGTGTGANVPVTTTTNTQSGIPATQVPPSGTSNGTVPAEKVTQTTHAPESKTQKAKEGAQDVKGKVASALPGHSDKTNPTGAKGSDTSTTAVAGSTASSSPAAATTATQPGTGDQTSGHRASTGSADNHKVGFMDKVKGEVKVISGKLGKNEKKVEEGRHLMGKA